MPAVLAQWAVYFFTSASNSKYCNAYSRPLEAIILYQMIYSRSLPAIEAYRYVY